MLAFSCVFGIKKGQSGASIARNRKKRAIFAHPNRPDGGIGRRDGLKHRWSNPSRFEPGSGHQLISQLIDSQWLRDFYVRPIWAYHYHNYAIRNTQFGIGPLVLINSTTKVPAFIVFRYRHRFSDYIALNLYGGMFGLDYTPSNSYLITIGGDIDVRSF